ncbi:alpha/beta hydrolase [Rhizobium alvei]|uniref:Alpha/beta hydrolase n=1 Tax=Rhizobium alvei TaxID=1132659 RepID=A0ABT8YR55_9HYPH|nr:alpha/beta hydrolase [Rhizobium alvei]MDO6966223.1 alpha/beta hydrolase [Rhizobium alvei]
MGDYITKERPGKPGQPLVFVFHGTGGDENQFLGFAASLLPEATIVAPRGDVSERGAARFFRRTGEGVYDMADLARATEKMAAFVKAKKAEHGATEVWGLGYSNGANILASVMFAHGALFDRAALLHPLIPFQPNDNPALAGKRILMTAGEHDPICPPGFTCALDGYFDAQGAVVTTKWHKGGHEILPEEIEAVSQFFA